MQIRPLYQIPINYRHPPHPSANEQIRRDAPQRTDPNNQSVRLPKPSLTLGSHMLNPHLTRISRIHCILLAPQRLRPGILHA